MKKLSVLIIVLIIILIVVLFIIPKRPSTLVGTSDEPILTPSPSNQDLPEKTPTIEKDKEISFKDPHLEDLIRDMINKPIGSIFLSELITIKEIEAPVYRIHHIDDLVYFTSLEKLDLRGNKINDISALKELVNLRYLDLSHNFSALGVQSGAGLNLDALKNLTRLEDLYLDKNYISNIEPLANLVSLKNLSLRHNRLHDISPLERLVKLTSLDLSENFHTEDNEPRAIADIGPLNNLLALERLEIEDNMITDLSPLADLENLSFLNAAYNKIASIDCFLENGSIIDLNVADNIIIDFDVILTMPSLRKLNYTGNPIGDYRAITSFEERIRKESINNQGIV